MITNIFLIIVGIIVGYLVGTTIGYKNGKKDEEVRQKHVERMRPNGYSYIDSQKAFPTTRVKKRIERYYDRD